MSGALPLKNTKYTYGAIAIGFHWIVAAAFIVNYVLIYYREWFLEPRTDGARALLSYHTAIGISVLVFVALRILWRFMSRQPADVPGSAFEHLASHSVHILLYLVMIVFPLSGYLGTGGPSQLFFFIEVPSFKETATFNTVVAGWMGVTWEQFEGVMDFVHKQGGAYVVWILIAAHAAAALFHHLVRGDIVLKRMVSPRLVPEDDTLIDQKH